VALPKSISLIDVSLGTRRGNGEKSEFYFRAKFRNRLKGGGKEKKKVSKESGPSEIDEFD
jgi:hypothetical protein